MKNNKIKANTLIKRKKLKQILKTSGIKRINKRAINFIENLINRNLINAVQSAKQNMEIHGRKTLRTIDIKEAFRLKNKEENFEI
jgi:histone H3/H4